MGRDEGDLKNYDDHGDDRRGGDNVDNADKRAKED